MSPSRGGEEGPRTAREMLARAREFLARKGVDEARLEAELLVAHALGLDRLRLFLELDRPVEAQEVSRARELLVRRGRGEPTAYLTGVREFYGRSFHVRPGVLVPRPETELVVDLARERLAGRRGARVLDVGTGSGCLAVTLALELDAPEVVAVDVSPAAVEVARENAARLGARVELRVGDALAPLGPPEPGAAFDLVVSNPPYVAREHAADLPREVREHEPAEALLAPPGDPDHWALRLLAEAGPRLRPGGTLLVELGFDQAPRLAARPGLAGAGELRWHADLAGVTRVLEWTAGPGQAWAAST